MSRRRHPARRHGGSAAQRQSRDVFINHAFGPKSEYLYLSLIAGITASGMNPRSVVEIPANEPRLDRLLELISTCPYSVHDLSEVRVTPKPFRAPRFNMAFELGLAVAIALRAAEPDHQFVLLESEPRRLNQSLSDMDGFDPYIHSSDSDGVLGAIQDIFIGIPDRPLDDLSDLQWVYQELRRFRRQKFPPAANIYRAHPFGQLSVTARALVDVRVRGQR